MLADAEQPLLQFAVGLEPRRFHDPVDPAVDHDRDFLGDRGGDADVLLDDKDADIGLVAERDQNLLDLLDDERSEPLGRLVHHQQVWIEEQRTRDREHLLLAAGELIAAVVAALGEPRKCFVDARNRPSRPVVAGGEAQMLLDSERGPEPAALRHVAEADLRDLRRGAADELLAHEPDRSAGHREQADDRLAQSRLAHAVAADERQHAVLDPQIDALQRMAAAVEDVQSPDFQKVCGATLRHGHHRDTIAALRDPPRSRAARLP